MTKQKILPTDDSAKERMAGNPGGIAKADHILAQACGDAPFYYGVWRKP